MRHGNVNRKFNRVRKQRRALLKSLVFNLIMKERLKTTEAKAKELRPVIEKLVTKAKQNTIARKRLLLTSINSKDGLKKLFDKIAPKYLERNGGYTRILKLGPRKSDNSKMAIIEFI